ncbi:MAG: hypothetical protein FJ276_35265 [Planctomycetes bacterium]|nr:hypothetical protein [Planctomycetota bacterium]
MPPRPLLNESCSAIYEQIRERLRTVEIEAGPFELPDPISRIRDVGKLSGGDVLARWLAWEITLCLREQPTLSPGDAYLYMHGVAHTAALDLHAIADLLAELAAEEDGAAQPS